MKTIKYTLLVFLLSITACKTDIRKFPENDPIEYPSEEKVFVNFKENKYLIIKNQRRENIVVNTYTLRSATLTLMKEVNGEALKVNPIPVSLPPENSNDYDTIIKPNDEIKILLQGLYILGDLPPKESVKACIYYRVENAKNHQEICSDWEKINRE